MTPTEEASLAVLKRHARSFRTAAWFLSPSQRKDAAVAYAFCRLVDDSVDEAESLSQATLQLSIIESMLEGTRKPSSLVRAYRDLAKRAGFGLDPARGLIAGARSDLGRVRIPTDEALLTYCYRVAGTVGLMMCGILGVRDAAAKKHAVDLGMAMQLTNICRDVLEDGKMGRIYLPRSRLAAVGVFGDALLETPPAPGSPRREAVAKVIRDLLSKAEDNYASGAAGYPYLPRRARLAIQVAATLYRGIGRRLLRVADGDSLHGRTILPWYERAFLISQALGSWWVGSRNQAETLNQTAAETHPREPAPVTARSLS